MSLTAGARLGPYEVVAPLGAGGMGEVYKARDTRLDRSVAIKVLPAALALDPQFRERFEREAKSISALNHPNICTLYDVGREGDTEYLVMELLEGETLAARIQKGPLPSADALRIAIEIASALDKAHRLGIVHRDFKPGNVMLTKSGSKLLDFGLAKVGPVGVTSGTSATAMPTMTSPLTARGTLLGTFQYMAPEQIEGEEADARTDIFAFGAVLYEMITGRKAFTGKSHASLMGAILKDEPPPVSTEQPMTPPALDRVVKTCLAKDPDDRFQSAHDLLLQLQWIVEGGSAAGVPAPIVAQRRQRERAVWVALGIVTALWLATLWPAWKYFNMTPDDRRIQFSVETPPIPSVGIVTGGSPVLSPDGRFLVFVAQAPGQPRMLWLTPLDGVNPRSLPGTEDAITPFWSADSREIGFGNTTQLRRIDIRGGLPQMICPASILLGATWNRKGDIVFAGGAPGTSRLWRVPASGGQPLELAQPDRAQQESVFASPSFLPDGRHFIYTSWSSDRSKRGIYVRAIDGGAPTLVQRAESMGLFAAGFLYYLRDGSLMAQAFDDGSFRTSGEAVRVAEGVTYSTLHGRGAFTVSADGILAYRTGGSDRAVAELEWFDRSGKSLGVKGDAASYNQVRLSPDEKRVVTSRVDPRAGVINLYTLDLSSNVTSQLTFGEAMANDPAWSPDGRTVAFVSLAKGKRDFFQQLVGTREATLVYESSEDPKWIDDWSPDGRFLLFHVPLSGNLYALPFAGDRKPIELAHTLTRIDSAHFSPDSRWVSYATDESGEYETWVASFPKFDKRRQVSARGGSQARWRDDMKELFYLTRAGQMMSVAIATDPKTESLEFMAPVLLFQSPLPNPNLTLDQYDVTRDGKRFLFIKPKQDQADTVSPITVVVNWPALIGSPKSR